MIMLYNMVVVLFIQIKTIQLERLSVHVDGENKFIYSLSYYYIGSPRKYT